MLDDSTLNESQLQAVHWEDGPLLVLAGPGSGKTRVLTDRITRLIEASPSKFFKILGLTFTHKAAAEMRDRIAACVPDAVERTLLTTFHSFSADLLRQHGHFIGLKPDFAILAQGADRHSLLDEAIYRVKMSRSGQTSENLLPLITSLTENYISPKDASLVLERASFADASKLAEIYGHYRSLMVERNSLDFVGLIAEALGILESQSGVREFIQSVYPYICIDEFQDTNYSQYRLLCHLVNPRTRNLFVVADDDQIIYQWNGASPDRMWSLREQFEMELYQLPENYRCPEEIVTLANNLISHNSDRYAGKSKLKALKRADGFEVVKLTRFRSFDEEVGWVANQISNLSPDDRRGCVVLARTRKLLQHTVEALKDAGLEGFLAVQKNEFEGASLKWVHSALRLAISGTNGRHLRNLCEAFSFIEGIELKEQEIISFASAEDIEFLRGWALMALRRHELAPLTRHFIEHSLLATLVDRLDFWKFQDEAFTWLDEVPDANPPDEGAHDVYNEEKSIWNQLATDVSAKFGGRNEVTLHLFLQELDLRSKAPEPGRQAIPCYTIHASKGMEFDHVFLVGMVEDQLPAWSAVKKGDDSREMREERRNCFVAITRAQKTLTVSYSDSVQGWTKKPSRFLYEMGLIVQ